MAGAPDTVELVRRALAYPYSRPGDSFLQLGEETLPLPADGIAAGGRRALLAYGANAAPEALARKLAHLRPRPLPVLGAQLADFDVVYSAHVTRYGAVPAALVASPGTTASVHLVLPDPEQMKALAASEGANYRLEILADFACEMDDDSEPPAEIDAFLSVHGPLLRGGKPIALAAIRASGRRFDELQTPAVIDLVRESLAPDLGLAAFVARCRERGGFSPLAELAG